MSGKKYIIGIDPDCDKSGVAVKDTATKKITLGTLSFFKLFDFLKKHGENIEVVKIEAAWLIEKSNWHVPNAGAAVSSRIGKNVGANHESGRKIAEMCEYLKVKYELVKPLRKRNWKGPNGKITHKEWVIVSKSELKSTNQEERDAGLLVL